MSIEINDHTGQMRSPEEFRAALDVVGKRLVRGVMPNMDVELFMQYTTIIEALRIAMAVSTARQTKEPAK